VRRGITHLENTSIDWRIILKWILNTDCVDLFLLAKGINHRRVTMYIIMNLPFHARYTLGHSEIQLHIIHTIPR